MGVVINDAVIEVPGIETVLSWHDDKRLRLKKGDYRARPDTWVRGIVLHTTKGMPGGSRKEPQDIRPGNGPNAQRDIKIAQMWSMDDRKAGAHLVCDHDSSWSCLADLQNEAALHAGNVNNVTIGIEIYQGSKAEMYEEQLASVVKMVDFLTKTFSIQRQLHWPYKRKALDRGLNRGTDMVGVYGHRDCSNRRGEGDPGDPIMSLLMDAGYEAFDFSKDADKDIWETRQEQLGLLPDGVPGPKTAAALLARGYPHGLWVSRPGD